MVKVRRHQLQMLLLSLLLCVSVLSQIICSVYSSSVFKLKFPQNDSNEFHFVLSNSSLHQNDKWSWQNGPQSQQMSHVVYSPYENSIKDWRWLSKEKLHFQSSSEEIEQGSVKWPTASLRHHNPSNAVVLKKNLLVTLPSSLSSSTIHFPTNHMNPPAPPDNFYTIRYGEDNANANKKIGWLPNSNAGLSAAAAIGDNLPLYHQVYPKHLYYRRGYPRESSSKRFSLEIHPAYLVAPLAGLATFGLVSKLVKTPVLFELGLMDKENDHGNLDNGASSNTKLHQHQHQHEHHHKPGGQLPPGIIGIYPITVPASYPGVSSSMASASAQASAIAAQNPTGIVTQFPIILGTQTQQTTNPADQNKPWWSPFAAMIPRLRSNSEQDEPEENDLERD